MQHETAGHIGVAVESSIWTLVGVEKPNDVELTAPRTQLNTNTPVRVGQSEIFGIVEQFALNESIVPMLYAFFQNVDSF